MGVVEKEKKPVFMFQKIKGSKMYLIFSSDYCYCTIIDVYTRLDGRYH